MKKFMIFLLMAFLYLGTCQAGNESASLSNDVGKSLRHWIAPSLSPSAGDELNLPVGVRSSMMPADSTVRVMLIGPSSACAGQVITLTAVVENNYWGEVSYQFRRNGNYITEGVDPVYKNRIQVTVPDLGGLDSLIQEYDVTVTQGCHTVISPVHYLRVNSINVLLDSVLVCSDDSKGLMCAQVFGNYTEAPYSFVWYQNGTAFDTTYTPCKLLSVGDKYSVEPHFTWNACVAQSNESKVKVGDGPAEGHFKLVGLTATACNGNQVVATLSGLSKEYGQPAITWTLNGHVITTAHDSVISFSPMAVAGEATNYILKAKVSYANYDCKEYTVQDTITMLPDPTVAIYGDAVICAGTAPALTAVLNGVLSDTTYIWKVDGVVESSIDTCVFNKKLSPRNYPYEISLIVTDSASCTAVSEPFMLYVDTANTVKLLSSASTVCKNDGLVTLTANVANADIPGLTYQWFKKVGAATKTVIDNAITSTYTTTVTDTTTFYIAVTTSASSCEAIDSVTVNVYEDAPAVKPLVLETSNASICDGGQVTFTLVDTANLNQYPGAVASYQWTVNGVEFPPVTGTSYTAAPISSNADTTIYNIHIIATYQLECSTETASIDTVVKVYHTPTVAIYGDAVVCNPAGNVELSAVVNGIYNGKYTWKVDGVDSLVDGTAKYVDTLPSRDYPYEITVALNDTVTGCTVISDPFMVYVGFNPVVEVTVSADTVCQGNEVVVTANVADINTPGLTYTWSKKDADDSTHILGAFGPSITYAVEKDTKFFVHIQQNHTGCTAYGVDSVKVYENALPVKPIALEVSDAYVCYGGQIEFTVIDTANRKQYYNDLSVAGNYAWYLNGVRLNNVSGDHFTFSPSTVDNDTTNYLVEVVASYELQCETLTATIDTTVSVQANPTVVISGDPIVCDGTALNLTATVHNALDSVTYLWRVDGVDSTTAATFTSKLDVRDYPYEITVVINQGSACEVVSDVYPVLIGINPTVEIGVSAPIVCKNEEVTLTAHLGDYNMPNLTYQWYQQVKGQTDTTTILVGTSRELTIPVADTTKYMVKVSQVNSECFAWGDTVINVYPKEPDVQNIELVTSQAAVCFGGQIEFTVIDTANRKQYFGSDTIPGLYQWYKNGVLMPLATTDHYTFSPDAVDNDSTNYLIEVVATYVTECETLTTSVDTTITAYPNPSVVISGDPFVCDTNLVKLVAIVSDTLISPKYLWRVDGADSLNLTTDTFEVSLPYRDYPYEISVVVNQGSACEVVSEPYLVYVDTKPVVVVTADYDTVCKDQIVTLTAHLGNYNQENLTYQWYADSVAVPEGTEATLAYTITNPDFTAFKVVVTQLNSNCQGTGFDTVITVANPQFDTVLITNLQDDIFRIIDGDTVNFHSYYNQPAYDVCEGASIQITAYMKDASGNRYIDTNITYNWKRNGVEIEGVHGAYFQEQLSIIDHDLYKYIYTVEIAEPLYPNCYAEPVSASSDTVRVRRNPNVVIGGQQYVCYQGPAHNNILLQAWVDGAVDTNAIYNWYRDGQAEENPYNANYGAIFTGPFAPRYGYNYTFQVEVVTGSGCSSFSEPYEVTVMDAPIITVTPSEDTVCQGGNVVLVSHLDNYNVLDYELQYQWYANEVASDHIVPGATSPVLDIDVNETTNYIVSVEYLTENSNHPYCIAADTMTVSVYDRPQIDNIIMSLTEVCEGSQVELTAVMDSVHAGVPNVPYIYEWYRNSELLPGNAATIYDSPLTVDGNEQQYTYSVIVYQYPERMMCESPLYVSSQTLTVYPNPIVAISGDQHVCHTDTIILSANSDTISNPVGGLHYYWFESGAPIDNLNGDSPILKYYGAAQDEPYRFTVQVERDNASTGCRSYSYEYDVYVYESPVVNVTVVDENVCEGAEVTVTAHLNQNVPEQTNLEFQWFTKTSADTDYVLVPGATALTYTTTIFDTTEFMFKVVHTLTGCFDTDSKTINTFEIPVVTNITLSDTTVCEGAAITITAFIDSTKGIEGLPYFYEWRRNGELMPGNTNIIHDTPMTVDGTTESFVYSAIAYQTPERLACTSALTESARLIVLANPRVAISGDQTVCYNENIILHANVDTFTNVVGGLHYTWYESGNMIVNLNGDSPILSYHAPVQNEPYRFTVQIEREDAERGCRAYSEEYDVYVMDAPDATVTIVDENVCKGAEVTVTAHLDLNDPEQTNLVYQWFTKTAGDAYFKVVPGATALTYTTTINETTEFMFRVENTLSGCVDTDTKTIHTVEIPVVTNIAMSDTTVCEGAAITITAFIDSTKGIEDLPYFYEWRRNGELMPGNTNVIHDTPVTVDGTTESFVYSAIAYQTPERLACTSELTESARLIVLANPRVAISGDQTVCHTDHIILNANVDTFTNVVGGLHYTWYESGNVIENLNGDSGILDFVAPVQNEPYRFTVQIEREDAERGCRAYSEEYDVYVMDAPEANVTIVDEYVCAGAEVTVTAHLNLNDPEQTNLEYQWYTKTASDLDYELVPGATALTYTTTIDGTTEFMFKVVNTLSGCFDTDSKTINVQPIPVVNYVSMSDTNICEGAQVTIYADVEATAGVANQPYFFEWRRNGELIEGVNTQTITDSPVTVDGNEQTFVYSVIAYQTPERLACYSNIVKSAQLNVFPNPRVAISGDQYVCGSDSVFLYANVDTIARPVGLLHYTWYESGRLRDNMAYGLADSRFFSEYFYPQAEPYRFTVEVQRDDIAAGCRSYSEEFLVWVYEKPVVNITASETEVCVGGEVTLRANLNNYEFDYANDAQYQWYTVDTVLDVIHIGWDSVAQQYIDSTIVIVEHNAIPGATMLTYNAVMTEGQVFGFTATHNLSGCSDYDELAINVLPRPIIDSIHNVTGKDSICPGGRVELVASVSGGVQGGEVFIWTRNGVVLESVGNTLIDYPLAVDNDVTKYVYAVTVRQAGAGCVSEMTEFSQYTMWVVPNPTVELAGDPIVCDTTDNNIVITANVVNYLDTNNLGLTYQWYENNAALEGETGLVLSVHRGYRDYPYSFNFAVQNEYGCTVNSEPFLVYVNDNPVVHISATETDICTNGVVTLTADLYDQNADNLVYQWYINNEPIEGAFNATYTTALTDTSTFKLYVGQRDSHCAAYSNEVTVNVNDIPVVTSIDVESVSTEICEGHVVTLKANIDGGVAGGEVYTWYKDNEIVAGVTGDTYTDYPMSSNGAVTEHIYNVTVAQTAAACESVLDASKAVTITVIPNPSYSIFGDADVCEPAAGENNIVLQGITSDPTVGTNPTYTWYEDGIVIAGQTTDVLAVSRSYREEPYIFKLIVTNTNTGCTSETAEFAVTVAAKPIASIAADQDSICEGGFVTLTSTLMDSEESRLTYQWQSNANGTWEDVAGAIAPVYVTSALNATTKFRLHVTNLLTGCKNNSNEVTVTVNEIPVVTSIDVESVSTEICEGHVVTLKANIAGGVAGGEVYTWYKDNEIVAGVTGDTYTDYPMSSNGAVTEHIYNVTVAQPAYGCESVLDAANAVTIKVVPNPVYAIYGDADVCEPIAGENNIVLHGITNDPTVGTNPTYTWYENGVEIAGQNTDELTVSRSYREEPYLFKLIVTNANTGCTSETAEFAVTVAAKPIASIAADQDSICEGGFVTLTSTLMDSEESRLTYQWQSNANGTWEDVAGAIAPVYVTSALNATTKFRLHVTNLLTGCVNNSNEVTVTVKSTPVVAITSINTNNVCNGGEVVLKATQPSEYQGIGEVSYQWFNNGQAIEGANSATYTTSPLTVEGDMTTYTFGVQVTMTNSACVSNVAETVVSVYADPTVVVTYDNGLTLCEGGQTVLTANADHALFTEFDYQWYFQGQPIQGANEATYTVENLAASQNPYEYAVEVKVNNGTTNGCSVVSEPVYVTIAKDPTAYITVNEGVNAICEGGNVTFTVNVNDGVADTYNPYTYVWTSNVTGTEILGTDASFTTSTTDEANLYVYYVTVASEYGCNVTVADTLRIVEDPTVNVSVKVGADPVVCEGGFTTLIATVQGGLGDASYQWYKNGYAIEGANSSELVTDPLYVNQAAAYTVSVAQSGIACTATSTQFNVPVYEAIEVALTSNSEVNCVGGSVTLTATANNGIPGDQLSYQWYRNGNPINGANAATYTTDDNLIAGLYEYQVEVASSISGCHVAQSGTIGITVEAEPTIVITSNAGNSICEGGDITLTANVIYATNATQHNNVYNYTWKWYEGTTLMSYVTTEPHYTLPATMTAGTYNFFVEISSVDGLGCDATSLANNNNFFTVVVKPVPSVILTASSDASCEGGDVTFNAVVVPTNLTGAYYWTVNGTTTVSNSNSITVNNMVLGTNNISVVFTPNDAQLACGTASVAITHTVSAAPVVTVAATDNNRLNMCVGGTIAFNASATGNANSSDNYVWTVDGQTQYGNNGTSFSTQLNTPGIHTVSAMVERTMGCNSQFSTPVVVVVAEQPVAQLTQTAGYTEMCVGGEITLMAKVANYATVNNGVTNSTVHGTYTYSWNRDNANIQTTTSTTDNSQITETLNTDAAYTYSVTITPSGYNCQAATATLDHSINVVPDPSWSVNQVNPSEMCLGGIVTLNAEVTGGVQSQQAGRIQWYKTFNGVESEVAGLGGYNTDVPEAAGVYTYAPKYIDYIGAGCNIADATATQVTVNALPTAQFTAGHGSVICAGDYQHFATLEITLTGTAPYTFTIMNVTSGESQTIVTSLNPYYYNVNPTVTSIYRITSVSDANGCAGTLDNVADVVVNVSDITVAASTAIADCETWIARIPLQINAATSNTFVATLPNGTTQTGNIMYDSYTQMHYAEVNMNGFAAGAYNVVISVDGCSGQCIVNVPANDQSIGASSALVDQRWDDVVVVNNNPANNGGYKFSTYQWYRNGELIPGATNQYYQEEGGLEGFYACELDGIRLSDGAHVHFITCEKYFSGHSSIRVYPVPATTSQEVTIELNLTDEELDGAILDIYDVKGAHIRSLSNLTPITKVGNFGAQGTYFGRIITGTNEIKTVKFIIVK